MRASTFFFSAGGSSLATPARAEALGRLAQRRLRDRFVVSEEQLVDARFVMLGGEHQAVASEDFALDSGVEPMIAPSRDNERFRRLLVPFL